MPTLTHTAWRWNTLIANMLCRFYFACVSVIKCFAVCAILLSIRWVCMCVCVLSIMYGSDRKVASNYASKRKRLPIRKRARRSIGVTLDTLRCAARIDLNNLCVFRLITNNVLWMCMYMCICLYTPSVAYGIHTICCTLADISIVIPFFEENTGIYFSHIIGGSWPI